MNDINAINIRLAELEASRENANNERLNELERRRASDEKRIRKRAADDTRWTIQEMNLWQS